MKDLLQTALHSPFDEIVQVLDERHVPEIDRRQDVPQKTDAGTLHEYEHDGQRVDE